MKFLDPYWETRDIIPLNVTYDGSDWSEPDILTITFKDLGDNTIHFHTIKEPKIEVWIVKEEYRTFTHHRNYIKKEELYSEIVPYRSRFKYLANKYKMTPDDVKYSPYILQTDVDVKTAYLFYFLQEYPTDKLVHVDMGYLDIENDTIDFEGFPPSGHSPINIITYISGKNKISHTVALRNPKNPLIQELEDNLDGFIAELHEEFDDKYGEFEYDISFYDDEITMIATIFGLINLYEDDFIGGWNMPYDAGNLIDRCRFLGYNPEPIMCHKDNGVKKIEFRQDDNPNAPKRKHILQLGTKSTWCDMLVNYAGIRAGGPKLPSMKLNAIAKEELKDEKYDYSEAGNIKTLCWNDYRLFMKYNIKDVLLLKALDDATEDIQDVVLTCTLDGMLMSDAFVTTTQLTNSMRLYWDKKGWVLGNNRNKLFDAKDMTKKYLLLTMSDDEADEEMDLYSLLDMEEEFEEDDDSNNKKKNYAGALVSHPNRMKPTGHFIDGFPSDKVHDYVIDFDASSEYPSAMEGMNASNETFVGKVMLKGEKDIPMPMYYYKFIDSDEASGYKIKPSELMVEMYSEGDLVSLAEIFLDLPGIQDIIDLIDKNPSAYMKK